MKRGSTPRPGRGHKTKAACPQFRKPRMSEERVRAMHCDYLAGMSLIQVGAKHGRHAKTVGQLFARDGLPLREKKYNLHRADGCFVAAPPLTDAQIEQLILKARRIEVPAALKHEWRTWPLERRGWFINRLRAHLNQPGHLPPGPFSANVERFDYATPRAWEIAAARNQGHDSKTAPIKLKVASLGVIYDGWCWCWIPAAGQYVHGPHTKGLGRPTLHHEIWKKANNATEIPRGHVVRFADGNQNNLDPANLVLVKRDTVCRENQAASLKKKSSAQLNAILNRTQADHANKNTSDVLSQLRRARKTRAHVSHPPAGKRQGAARGSGVKSCA